MNVNSIQNIIVDLAQLCVNFVICVVCYVLVQCQYTVNYCSVGQKQKTMS